MRVRSGLLLLLVAFVVACAPSARPPSAVPDAQASFVVWREQPLVRGAALDGAPVETLAVEPGQIVRLEVRGGEGTSSSPLAGAPRARSIELLESAHTETGVVETRRAEVVESGVVLVRAGAFTTLLAFAPGVVRRAFLGHGSDPGVGWLDHARRVLAWAEGPLPAPFPLVVPSWRVDRSVVDRLERVLAADLAQHAASPVHRDAARAVRAVVGLRQLHAVQPLAGYPYTLDAPAIAENDAAAGNIEGHDVHRVGPNKPLKATATGPATLSVWAWADDRGPERITSLSVMEGDARRATTSRRLRRNAGATEGSSKLVDESSPHRAPERLTRTIVHVPPGEHVYRIESDGALLVSAIAARPVLPIELRSRGEEGALLARATHACDVSSASATCRLARALAAPSINIASASGPSMAASGGEAPADEVAQLVSDLSSGRPHDGLLDHDIDGAQVDGGSFAALEQEVAGSVDDATRSRWIHAIQRDSAWRSLPGPATDHRWAVALHRDGADSSASDGGHPEPRLVPVAKEAIPITSSRFHDTTVVELVWAGQPPANRVELEVDGQRLSALPRAAYGRWHIRVRGDVAQVRRLDGGAGDVFAASASMRLAEVPAAVTEDAREIVPSPGLERGLGIELWAREDSATAEVDVEALHGGAERVLLRAKGVGAALAVDELGHRWRRVGRAALPAWASQGARLHPRDGTAYRTLVRAIAEPPAPAAREEPAAPPPSTEAIVALSREVLSSDGPARARALRERALALAARGARTAALIDARAAMALGLDAEQARSLEAEVERAADRANPPPPPLPATTAAYGIEPDFDDEGAPRAAFERALAELPRRDATTGTAFDAERGARIVAAARAVPLDPRSLRAVHRALAGARWRTLPKLAQAAPDRAGAHDTIADGDGLLLPRIATGMPFAEDSFVAISADRPSAFRFQPNAVGARYHLDVVCAATALDADVNASCTPHVVMGDVALEPSHAPVQGRARYDIPAVRRSVRVQISVDDAPLRWVAVARLVSDREVEGADLKTAEGWVVSTPRHEPQPPTEVGRYPLALRGLPALVRVRATTTPADHASIALEVDGVSRPIEGDGSELVLEVRASAILVVTGGHAWINVAERVPSPHPLSRPSAPIAPGKTDAAPLPSHPVAVVSPSRAAGQGAPDWSSIARGSPRPLTAFESNLGTLVVASGAVVGTLKDATASRVSWFSFLSAGYRRRIERIGLWTDLEGFTRVRHDGPPTFGATGVLYEDLDAQHVRLSTTAGVESQRVLDGNAVVWLSRGFAEYSGRVTRDFFILPRVGWDYVGMSLHARPRVAASIDNEVWNSYRSKRPTFLFLQGLFWWVPYFNEITYLRMRVTHSPNDGAIARVSARPGAFLALGSFDLSVFEDTAWSSPSQSTRHEAHVVPTAGVIARYDVWSRMGSLDIQPGVAGFADMSGNPGWQVNVFVNLFASYRRGLRDFSSLELDFPEQRSDGIPWRGNGPGGYR